MALVGEKNTDTARFSSYFPEAFSETIQRFILECEVHSKMAGGKTIPWERRFKT
jgi:hypothetical protein